MKRTLAFILTLVMVLSSFGMLSVVAAEGEGTATTTPQMVTLPEGYTQPEGEGTAENPYLIASAADLLWMARECAATLTTWGGTNLPAENTAHNPFSGKYFKQTQDIDIGGKILPSIGAINGAAQTFTNLNGNKKYALFGGIYDGQGYAIKNGYVVNQDPTKDTLQKSDLVCYYYGTGLFGVISGATIKNVNLKNFSIYTSKDFGLSTAGVLVGMAVADVSNLVKTKNQIINCTADENCKLVAKNVTASGSTVARSHGWGGLVGSAYGTDIIDCLNYADMIANNNGHSVGGIVGRFLGGTIKGCVNRGNISITNATTSQAVYNNRGFGGIVGVIPYNGSDTVKLPTVIESCANYGNISNDGAAVVAFACGGILGATRETNAAELVLKNCYNLGSINMQANDSTKHAEGAIIGAVKVRSSDLTSTAYITLTLDNVKTIALTNLRVFTEDDSGILGTGAVSTVTDGSNTPTALMNWTNLGTKADNVEPAIEKSKGETFTYAVSADSAALVKEADMIASCKFYVQTHNNVKGSYRFLATINGAEWESAAITLTLIKPDETKGTKPVEVTTCYDSILADGEAITDPSGRKFIVFAVSGIGEGWKYEISASVTDSTGTYESLVQAGEFG